MYPSILLLPMPMAGIYLLKKTIGPLKTLNYSEKLSNKIVNFIHLYTSKKLPVLPQTIHTELAILHRLTPHSLFACFELACVFQQWLALHGEPSKVVLGKCIINHKFRMHAWVETDHAIFFKEGTYDIVEWASDLNI